MGQELSNKINLKDYYMTCRNYANHGESKRALSVVSLGFFWVHPTSQTKETMCGKVIAEPM
jgi:hypothetical protein